MIANIEGSHAVNQYQLLILEQLYLKKKLKVVVVFAAVQCSGCGLGWQQMLYRRRMVEGELQWDLRNTGKKRGFDGF